VRIVLETGKSIAEVARDLDIHPGSVGHWVRTKRIELDRRPSSLRTLGWRAPIGTPSEVAVNWMRHLSALRRVALTQGR
jgi:transposase-like protein